MAEETITIRNAKDLDDILKGSVVRSIYADGPSLTVELESREEGLYSLILTDKATIGLKGDLLTLVRGLGISLTKTS